MKWSAISAAFLALALAGCAVNPATGKQQLSLIGEQDEIAMGREADGQIVASLGLYDDPGVQAYVQELGRRLAAQSERSQLKWTFRVVDDPTVNAFALPGGYIYVTRGLMAHLVSEAELAGVIGHEIGHVTARHSVNQLSKAQLANLGLGLGMILKPEWSRYGDLTQTGLGVLFLKYGRDDERQADDLGLRYMTRTGYDPHSLEEVFTVLERVGQSDGGGRVPAWLSTHPDPGDRRTRIAAAIGAAPAAGQVGREEYLQHLDGMVYGPDPREGFFENGAFVHPNLRLRFEFPPSWAATNEKQMVYSVSADKDAIIQLTLSSKASPQAASQEFFGQEGIERGQAWRQEIHGLPAVSHRFRVLTSEGTLAGIAAFVQYDGKVFQLLAYTPESRFSTHASTFERSLASFDRLTDRRLLSVEPLRIDIVRPDRNLTSEQFLARYPSPVPGATVALINHLDPGEQLRAGQSAKRIVGDALAVEVGQRN